jgi:serine/threonine protein kinase
MRSTISRVGKYDLKTVIARTATSVIYDGWDADIARRVAVKVILASAVGGDDDPDSLARFKRGAQAAGQLAHPNIVAVYDYGESEDHAYIVMEYIDGPTLKARFDNKQPFSMPAVYKVVGDMLRALQYSHDHGVVHRDMKPANIMFSADGTLKITDFGIARLEDSSMTQTGIVIGTPAYMSPEQFTGEKIDWRTDIYSTGAILYEMLTGERPYEGNLATIMHKTLYTPPPRPSRLSASVTPALDHIVTRAMAKKREDRFQSATEFDAALQAIQAPTVTGVYRPLAPPVSSARPARRDVRQPAGSSVMPYWKPASAAGLVAVVAIATGWYALPPAQKRLAPAAPDRIEANSAPAKTIIADKPPAPVLPPLPLVEETVVPALPAPVLKTLGPASEAPPPMERMFVQHNDLTPKSIEGSPFSSAAPPPRLSPELPDVASLPAAVLPRVAPTLLPQDVPRAPARRPVETPNLPTAKPNDTVLRQKHPANQSRPGGPAPDQAGLPSNARSGESVVALGDRSRPVKAPPSVPGIEPKDGLLPLPPAQKPPAAVPPTQASVSPPRYATTSINGALGLVCQTVTADTAGRYGLDAPRGMVVTGVLVGSLAYNAGIRRDDVIVKVNGSEVDDASALSAMTPESAAGGRMPVELLRAGLRRTVQIRVDQPRS